MSRIFLEIVSIRNIHFTLMVLTLVSFLFSHAFGQPGKNGTNSGKDTISTNVNGTDNTNTLPQIIQPRMSGNTNFNTTGNTGGQAPSDPLDFPTNSFGSSMNEGVYVPFSYITTKIALQTPTDVSFNDTNSINPKPVINLGDNNTCPPLDDMKKNQFLDMSSFKNKVQQVLNSKKGTILWVNLGPKRMQVFMEDKNNPESILAIYINGSADKTKKEIFVYGLAEFVGLADALPPIITVQDTNGKSKYALASYVKLFDKDKAPTCKLFEKFLNKFGNERGELILDGLSPTEEEKHLEEGKMLSERLSSTVDESEIKLLLEQIMKHGEKKPAQEQCERPKVFCEHLSLSKFQEVAMEEFVTLDSFQKSYFLSVLIHEQDMTAPNILLA